MFRIDTDAIVALRDRLLEAGGTPSDLAQGPESGPAAEEPENPLSGDADGFALFEAAVEAMVLMLAADGVVREEERTVLRGAVHELTAGSVGPAEVDRLADAASERIADQGANRRLAALANTLNKERLAAEAAFVLAAAMAYADRSIAEQENAMLSRLADALSIDEARANELLVQLNV
jgi:uncharacterized tellurite resistance protein B-like protein